MRQKNEYTAGSVHHLTLHSKLLCTNMLDEPLERRIDVYVPAGQDGHGLPLLVDLVGFLSGGPNHTNWRNFGENLPERLDRLIGSGAMAPVVVALPDCFTRLGGNQYINSPVLGPWADIIRQEVVPMVESKFSCGGDGKRGVFGKSSGGYGSLVHAMLYPDFWAAAASHSGDCGFELLYLPEFPGLLRALASRDFNPSAWLDDFLAKNKHRGEEFHTLLLLAMCASFDPDPTQDLGIRLPIDTYTCELITERWQNWLNWDPLVMVNTKAQDLKKLKVLYFDCGTKDQYNLLYGNRRLAKTLHQNKVDFVYEEFKDDHNSTDYRLDQSLPKLVKALC
jgi:enterochelin esterase-like enzyme